MAANVFVGVMLTGLAWALPSSGTASAAESASAPSGEHKTGGLGDLLKFGGSSTFPGLSGLIRPEKMGILTDNPFQVKENDIDMDLMSGNQTQLLSGIHFLSDISVNVHVTVQVGGAEVSKDRPKKADAQRHAKRHKRNKSRSKPKARS